MCLKLSVSTLATAAQFYSLLRKGPWVKNIPPKYLVKNQTEVTEVFYSNGEGQNSLSNLHYWNKKQTSAKVPFMKQSERFHRAKTNSTSKSYNRTKPLYENLCWNSREEHPKYTLWLSEVFTSRAILTLVWINALQSLTMNPSNLKPSLSLTFDSSKISACFSEMSWKNKI